MRLYAGIDAGSVSINGVVIDDERQLVYEAPYTRHMGRVEAHAAALIRSLEDRFGEGNIASIAFTGNHGKKLSEKMKALYEFEIISQVIGAIHVQPDARTVISMGGQDTAFAQVRHDVDGWELEYFTTNGPCASGTGSFIDQQAERLATALYVRQKEKKDKDIDRILSDFIALGQRSRKPASVACRCTVFTKSDMIHLQNKGERLEDIIYGLHLGNARNYLSTMVSNRTLSEPILFIGGLSLNALQVKALEAYLPSLRVPPHSTSLGALGVALQALDSGREDGADWEKLLTHEQGCSAPVGERLVLRETLFPESNEPSWRPVGRRSRCYLGIDVGSTTTKYALVSEKREIIDKRYVPTQGKPVEVAQSLLSHLRERLEGKGVIMGVATTGSGRGVVGDFLNADLIVDEITAHARGAVQIDPAVDTIFEIGGQDSKYIAIANTHPLDFDMNKVCAAGTGSFLHELANKYGISIVDEFQEIALCSEKPVKLAERCTVFMESDLVSYHQKGVSREDLIAGLCYAIVHNYLNRVVGKRRIGERVMFLGGPSLNKGVVAAFENVLGRGLVVPRHREVLGAFGAALLLQERALTQGKSTFRGLESAVKDRMRYKEMTCRADPSCNNRCKLKLYDFDGRKSIWGGECGRYECTTRQTTGREEDFFDRRRKIWEKHMEGLYETLPDAPLEEVGGRPTVGMLRALYGLQTSVLWAHFFDQLGYRLVLTPPTNELISKSGIETVVAETCYPVKVSHGHAKQLLGKTGFMFLPTLVDMATPNPSERGFYCPLVQSNAFMIRAALGIDESTILSPTLHLKFDPDMLALEFYDQVGKRLGLKKGRVREALGRGLDRQARFVEDLRQTGREVIERHDHHEPLLVVTGRPYNLHDERLNLRLGRNLSKIGLAALPMDFIDTTGIGLADFSSMFWGLGAEILRAARRVKETPNFFGLHLTNFSCGADSFLEHFYKHVMGDKPYLILELDEHSAVAGVMTRLEAYKNVVENTMAERPSDSAGLRSERPLDNVRVLRAHLEREPEAGAYDPNQGVAN
jgi:predicted CoA-substrate-specific enzyme activase